LRADVLLKKKKQSERSSERSSESSSERSIEWSGDSSIEWNNKSPTKSARCSAVGGIIFFIARL
jgi:hypothetical protein